MKGGFTDLLKQAQKMQTEMQKAQEELAKTIVKGKAGGNLVEVTMNCRHDIIKVHLDDSLEDEPKEVREDLIAAAFNDAVRNVEKASREKLNSITAGMQLPAGFESLAGSGGDTKE